MDQLHANTVRIVLDNPLKYCILGQPMERLTLSTLSRLCGEDRSNQGSIIAVHGLGSNVDWSWIWKDGDKRTNWLGDPDMLPARVRNSRIIVYNYESRWHANAPKTRLQLCGEELVDSIHSFRGGDFDRPLVFVGHSLGGNVIVHVSCSTSSCCPIC